MMGNYLVRPAMQQKSNLVANTLDDLFHGNLPSAKIGPYLLTLNDGMVRIEQPQDVGDAVYHGTHTKTSAGDFLRKALKLD